MDITQFVRINGVKMDIYNLTDEVYPLLYATSVGKYECSVTTKTEVMRRCFEVKGITFIII